MVLNGRKDLFESKHYSIFDHRAQVAAAAKSIKMTKDGSSIDLADVLTLLRF